nr:unnamed protein product [Ananas comosus var. bracteatus]
MENLSKVKGVLCQRDNQLEALVAADSLKWLGIDYHFTEEIANVIDSLYEDLSNVHKRGDLFEVTLSFRLLRQAGYYVSSDILDCFVDEKGEFRSSLSKDIRGMMSLHDSSHLNTGEDILYKANKFSRDHLKISMKDLEPNLAKLVEETLKHPYHMSLQSYKAKRHLSYCQRSSRMIGAIEEIAKREINLNQTLHQKEVKELMKWWKDLGLAQQLTFARDQLLKWYVWSMTAFQGPQNSKYRIELTKVIAFVYIIDDIFDVIGSLDELRIFTEVINKWEDSVPDSLPHYMRPLYMSLYNLTNEIANMVEKEHGFNPIGSLKRSWVRLCNAFMVEAKWFSTNSVPTTDEYLRNGAISTGVPTVFAHAFFLLGHGITNETIYLVESGDAALFSCPARILRLWDDLGSAKDENQQGFDGSYLDCYMKENPHCSTYNAREHVMQMISRTWEILNKECFSQRTFSPYLVEVSLNTARMVDVMYDYNGEQKLPMLEEYMKLLLFGNTR